MAIKFIPKGDESAILADGTVQTTYVTDSRQRDDRDILGHLHVLNSVNDVMCAVKDTDAHVTGHVKDAQAGLERSTGMHYAGTLEAVKDAQADLERSTGLHYAGTIGAVKDAQADLERSGGFHFAETLESIKDSYADTVKTLKDTEAQLDRASGNRYADILRTVKDSEVNLERSSALTRDVVRQSELAVEKSRAKIVEEIKDFEFENCKELGMVKDSIQDARKELLFNQVTGFKDNILEFKNTQNIMYQLAAAAEKTACQNQMQTLLQFKDQAMLSERLAAQASKELAECCCEIRQLVTSDGQRTREALAAQELDRLRERASKAEQQVTLLQLGIGIGGSGIGGLAK